jgi:hypothetical protein
MVSQGQADFDQSPVVRVHVVDQKSALSKEFLDKLPPAEKTRNRRRQQEHQLSIADCSCKVATLPLLLRTQDDPVTRRAISSAPLPVKTISKHMM